MSGTEDDTFRHLQRPDWETLTEIIFARHQAGVTMTSVNFNQILVEFGWTYDEYMTGTNAAKIQK